MSVFAIRVLQQLLIAVLVWRQLEASCPVRVYTTCEDMCDEGLRDPLVKTVEFIGSLLEGLCIGPNINFVVIRSKPICRNLKEVGRTDLLISNLHNCRGELSTSIKTIIRDENNESTVIHTTYTATTEIETDSSTTEIEPSSTHSIFTNAPRNTFMKMATSTIASVFRVKTEFLNLSKENQDFIADMEKKGIERFTIYPESNYSSVFTTLHPLMASTVPVWVSVTIGTLSLAVIVLIVYIVSYRLRSVWRRVRQNPREYQALPLRPSSRGSFIDDPAIPFEEAVTAGSQANVQQVSTLQPGMGSSATLDVQQQNLPQARSPSPLSRSPQAGRRWIRYESPHPLAEEVTDV